KNLKILVVDDTIFYRQLLSKMIEEMADIDLMGVASNGKIALKKIELSEPDLVLMDMTMPEMDGLEALKHIKANHPGVNVVMISGVDKEAATLTVKALEAGALDFISKPKAESPDAAVEELKSELIPLIALARTMKYSRDARMISEDKPSAVETHTSDARQESLYINRPHQYYKGVQSSKNRLQSPEQRIGPSDRQHRSDSSYHPSDSKNRTFDSDHKSLESRIDASRYRDQQSDKGPEPSGNRIKSSTTRISDGPASATPVPLQGTLKKRDIGRIDVLAIGVSTGGPNTLKHIIPKLCKDLPVPILTVQHMPPIFTASLAESLDRISSITVVEGKAEQPLENGIMYIAPGGRHMVVRKGADSVVKLGLVDTPPVHNCRPAVDVLFRSIAMVFGGNVLTVILTGMGHDGVSGVAAIRRKGGYSLAQDEKSSVVWGMPGALVEAGEVDEIHAEEQIADRIMELVKKSRL
ncbi:MAG: response regulator, partial [Desulfamplus sp.]|nr:response regulator [Desulfamplus sp.]